MIMRDNPDDAMLDALLYGEGCYQQTRGGIDTMQSKRIAVAEIIKRHCFESTKGGTVVPVECVNELMTLFGKETLPQWDGTLTIQNPVTINGVNMEPNTYRTKTSVIEQAGRDVAKIEADAKRWRQLKELCGHVEDGSCTDVTIGWDDATRTAHIKVGRLHYAASNLNEALDIAARDLPDETLIK